MSVFRLAAVILAVSAWFAPDAGAATRLAQISIRGQVAESAPELLLPFGGSEGKALVLREVVERIAKAGKDGKIDGLVLPLGGSSMGSSQASELRDAVLAFRKSGKKVHVWAETLDAHEYMVASAADRIALLPAGELGLHGMAVELTHYKGLMDRLGVEGDFIRNGKYKSAIEPMTERKPSEATLEMMNALLDDLYGRLVDSIAAGRKLTPEQVRKLIDGGPFTSEEALAAKLIDAVDYHDAFNKALENDAGGKLTLVENYGAKKPGAELDFDNPFALFKLFGEIMGGKKKPAAEGGNKIAVIYALGAIQSGDGGESLMGGAVLGSETFNKAVRAARDDASIKAVVLRIDSPGGSALASESMWREVKNLSKTKRVIVSMGDVAASGGYYIASAGDVIVADPSTITGSIGVFGGKMVIAGLYQKLDIDTVRLQRGANAGVFDMTTKFSDGERAVVERQIKAVYDTFLTRVAEGRKMTKEAVHEIAQGRVWSGKAAKEKGLVDELGGLDKALSIAAAKAGLRDYKLEILPKPKTFLELLGESLGGAEGRVGAGAVPAELRTLRAVLPSAGRPLGRMVDTLRVLERERVLMTLPFGIEVK